MSDNELELSMELDTELRWEEPEVEVITPLPEDELVWDTEVASAV